MNGTFLVDNLYVPIPRCLHRKHNAPFDANDFKLFEVPVFERCKKYGIPENRITKRTSPNPEMMVGLKLYAGN